VVTISTLFITNISGFANSILKALLSKMLSQRKEMGLNNVLWWGDRGVQIEIQNQYDF